MDNAACCPECGSIKLYKAGLRYLANGETVQRFLCRECGVRFSEKSYKECQTNSNRQICALKVKNLEPQTEKKTVAGEEKQTTKGRLLQFALHCKNEGLTEETVRLWLNRLKKISENTELNEPEAVKAYIAKATYVRNWAAIRRRL